MDQEINKPNAHFWHIFIISFYNSELFKKIFCRRLITIYNFLVDKIDQIICPSSRYHAQKVILRQQNFWLQEPEQLSLWL